MELTGTQEEYREWLVGLILTAKTLPEIDEARQRLNGWLVEHSDDLGLTDGFDHLAMSQLMTQTSDTEQKQAA